MDLGTEVFQNWKDSDKHCYCTLSDSGGGALKNLNIYYIKDLKILL